MFVNDNSSAEYETCRRTPIQTFADRENGFGREISVVCHNLSHCSYFMFFFHFSSVGAYPIQFSEIGLSFSNPVRLCLPVSYFAKFFLEIMVSDHQFGCANFHLICGISYYHLIGYFYAKKTITSLGTTAGAAVTMCSSE